MPFPPLFLPLPFSKKNKTNGAKYLKYIPSMVSVGHGQGQIQKGRMRARGIHPPTSHFQKCFGCRL